MQATHDQPARPGGLHTGVGERRGDRREHGPIDPAHQLGQTVSSCPSPPGTTAARAPRRDREDGRSQRRQRRPTGPAVRPEARRADRAGDLARRAGRGASSAGSPVQASRRTLSVGRRRHDSDRPSPTRARGRWTTSRSSRPPTAAATAAPCGLRRRVRHPRRDPRPTRPLHGADRPQGVQPADRVGHRPGPRALQPRPHRARHPAASRAASPSAPPSRSEPTARACSPSPATTSPSSPTTCWRPSATATSAATASAAGSSSPTRSASRGSTGRRAAAHGGPHTNWACPSTGPPPPPPTPRPGSSRSAPHRYPARAA